MGWTRREFLAVVATGSLGGRPFPCPHSSPLRLRLPQIYEAQPDISRAFQTRDFIPLPRLLAMVLVTTAPLVCSKTMFTQALNVSAGQCFWASRASLGACLLGGAGSIHDGDASLARAW